MRSLGAIFVEYFFKITKMKDRYNKIAKEFSEHGLKYINENVNVKKYFKDVKVENHYGRKVYVMNDGENKDTLFYVHGGGYIFPPTKYHYIFLNKLAKKLNLKIIFPLYGRYPKYTCTTEVPILTKIYSHYLKNSNKMYIAGDSAGGGLAVALNYSLINNNIKNPELLILFSPFMDISMDNLEIEKVTKHDPMLDIAPSSKLAYGWSDGDPHNPYASPLFGDVEKLPYTIIYTGNYDILYPDMKLFAQKLKKEKVKHEFHVKDKMGHVYIFYPIREASETFKDVCQKIQKTKSCQNKDIEKC